MNGRRRNRSDRGPSLGSGRSGNRRVCGLECPHGKSGGGVSSSYLASGSIAPVAGRFDRKHRRKQGQIVGLGLSNHRGTVI